MNVSHEMGSNLNIPSKMSYGVLECDIVMLQNAYDFVIKRGIRCAGPCILCVHDPIW